jgi:hypothetical protein
VSSEPCNGPSGLHQFRILRANVRINDLCCKSSISIFYPRHLAWIPQCLIINCDVACCCPTGVGERDPTRLVAGALALVLTGSGDPAARGSQEPSVLSSHTKTVLPMLENPN